ncbi:MAG: LytTR family transcriptional regulator DNA-binding domain-containing protein [Clostridia bacterium]|nr:LytTR family transcriptional regulator DNA-binding domain-containing protein [Clostridia bacterium]
MEQFIPFRNQKEVCRIPVSEVLYITQQRRKLKIVTHEREYVQYEKIREVIPYLDDRFYACLKYTYINMDKIRGFANQSIHFTNGEGLAVGRDNFNRTKKEFLERIMKGKRNV